MNTLVVYYSRTGHIAAVAKALAIENGYALEEIIETENRKGVFGFIKGGVDAALKRCGEILTMYADIASFDKVIICAPVWAGTMPPAIRTFFIAHAADIKEAEYIIMHGDKTNAYKIVFAQMDALLGKKSSKQTSLVTPTEK